MRQTRPLLTIGSSRERRPAQLDHDTGLLQRHNPKMRRISASRKDSTLSGWNPVGGYRPGASPLHRLGPGAKLLALFLFAIAVVSVRGPLSTAVALGLALACALIAGLRARDLARIARGFAIVAVLLFAFTAANDAFTLHAAGTPVESLWRDSWQRAFEVVGDLFALILAASALTASTAVSDMQQTVVWALGPLRPLGVRPDRVALAFSLVLGVIPQLIAIAHDTRAAAKARGLEHSPRALLVPFAIRTVAHAQLTGEALHARGIGDEEDKDRGE